MLLLLGCLWALSPQARAATDSSLAGAVTTASTALNVRAQASASSAVVASLSKGSYVTLIARSGSWWQVEYAQGQYGYCHADYITVVQGSPATVCTQSSGLNVRSGPGTGYTKTATLARGEVVLVLSTADGWSRVLYHGTKTGYVSAQYLSGSYAAVSLTVPAYLQTDSRWAGITLGSSGKTLSQIGCATTALAMMESYRTGTAVYPSDMAQQLRYTASGSLYWPSWYTVVTDGSGYLAVLYRLLSQGKPVLLGVQSASGSQHWVVVTGYTGGGGLTASGFTINDPGNASRTTLQQLLSAYPTFYKLLYY